MVKASISRPILFFSNRANQGRSICPSVPSNRKASTQDHRQPHQPKPSCPKPSCPRPSRPKPGCSIPSCPSPNQLTQAAGRNPPNSIRISAEELNTHQTTSEFDGRYWIRTSDPFRVKEVRYRCANRPYQASRLISFILKHHLPRGAGGLHAPLGDGTFGPGHFSEHPALVNGSAYRDYGLDLLGLWPGLVRGRRQPAAALARIPTDPVASI